MAKPKHIPRNAVVVERYQELNSFTQAFAAGHLRFLMVVGPAGTGKSRAMRSAVAGRAAWVDGNATAFGVYCAAFMHQDEPIVLDDVDALYRDANGIRLLKQLCQSEPSRLLGWYPTLSAWSDGDPKDVHDIESSGHHRQSVVNDECGRRCLGRSGAHDRI